MKRIGVITALLALSLAIAGGCDDETAGVDQTGINLRFANCLPLGIWVFVDDEYQSFASTEEPQFISVTAGSHTLWARSNAQLGDEFYSWDIEFSVSDGQITELTLDCTDALDSGGE
ncbi:MAG: hypothetical protein JW876_05700 [Candidatus Krumholzibacteriota bacterium]|nr:hypothetical protein [Candidatus Krumholzibacteriota bacterium]